MNGVGPSFRDFEHRGWEDEHLCAQYDAHLARVTAQSVQELLDAAAVGPGSYVLDVATGAGGVAAKAAERGANPIGVDFSATQISLAARRHPGLSFRKADADTLPFPAATFDAVVCAFGMCHFPDPDAALREAFRVLRPGGRVAFTVWGMPDKTVALGAAYGAIREHGTVDVGLPPGPSFFLLSTADASREALTRAGFSTPSFAEVNQVWRVTDPLDAYEALTQGTVRAAATLRAQAPEVVEAVRAALREAILQYRDEGGYGIPMPAALSAGVKPA